MAADDWIKKGLCTVDKNPRKWISLDLDDIEYAKQQCLQCPVRIPCLYQAVYETDFFAGVRGGLSEFEFLMKTWTEVTDETESNWTRDDTVLQGLFREIS